MIVNKIHEVDTFTFHFYLSSFNSINNNLVHEILEMQKVYMLQKQMSLHCGTNGTFFVVLTKNGKKSIKNRNYIAIYGIPWYTVWA